VNMVINFGVPYKAGNCMLLKPLKIYLLQWKTYTLLDIWLANNLQPKVLKSCKHSVMGRNVGVWTSAYLPCRRRQKVPKKFWKPPTRLHSIIIHKTIHMLTAVKTKAMSQNKESS
jgi:hypothetical protein